MPLLVKSLPTLHFFMSFSIGALTFAFLLRIILTWYPKIDLRTGFWPIIFLPTEPILVITRKIVAPIGGVDVTPIIWVGLLSLFRELFLGKKHLFFRQSLEILRYPDQQIWL